MLNEPKYRTSEAIRLHVPKARISSECADGIDTGEQDGSGKITVRAARAFQEGSGVAFQNVVIEAESPANVKRGYGTWNPQELINLASDMLRRDYCH